MTSNRIRQLMAHGAKVAAKLTKEGMRVRVTTDFGEKREVVTKSLPWQLGHGQWVVKLEGFSGGYDCARLEILERQVAA